MKLNLIDKSNYFRGMMLILRKDNQVSDSEKCIMRDICDKLGFNKRFCEESMDAILENQFIIDEPPVFSSPEFAVSFIKDGLNLAKANDTLEEAETEFLKKTAEINGIKPEVLEKIAKETEVDSVFPAVTEYV